MRSHNPQKHALPYRLRLRTRTNTDRIITWLEERCRKAWQIRFDGLSDDLQTKTLLVEFEDEVDMTVFREAIRRQVAARKSA